MLVTKKTWGKNYIRAVFSVSAFSIFNYGFSLLLFSVIFYFAEPILIFRRNLIFISRERERESERTIIFFLHKFDEKAYFVIKKFKVGNLLFEQVLEAVTTTKTNKQQGTNSRNPTHFAP